MGNWHLSGAGREICEQGYTAWAMAAGLRYKPVRTFFASMVLCSVVEYLASYFLERGWGVRWWDYSDQFLNISGRICLWGCLLFGVGGWLLVCYAMPYLRMAFRKIWKMDRGRKALQLACLLLILIFAADAAWAADFPNKGEGITARAAKDL